MKEYVINAKDMDEKELNRTLKQQATNHDTLIINFNTFARYMKSRGHSTEWRDALGDETVLPKIRKRIGDFACYLVFVNALNER